MTKKHKFYGDKPVVPAKKIADSPLVQNASLGNEDMKMVPADPGKISGLGGAAHAQPSHPRASDYGHGLTQRVGKIRLSGHPNAHQLGKVRPIKKI